MPGQVPGYARDGQFRVSLGTMCCIRRSMLGLVAAMALLRQWQDCNIVAQGTGSGEKNSGLHRTRTLNALLSTSCHRNYI